MNSHQEQQRWQRVKELLAAALEQSESERKLFLEEACSSDPMLRAEVESLLSYEHTRDRLTEGSQLSLKPPDRIGTYQIICSIGIGGMGTVYLAERADDTYHKQVAIKLIRQDMNTEFVLQRFFNERQILAGLDHPNISRLLDGGSVDGLPYLVMDYIEGIPIHEYCDQKNLNTEKRLGLFLQLCDAVQYAHQRLIIHRDIKPRNILVAKEGIPKLLDFGIAKLLTPELTTQTQTAMRLMTPEYASPEQLRGESITTATDIYSLGVVLYELLTGHSPYRPSSDAIHEIVRAICEAEPEKPSASIDQAIEIKNGTGIERITAETVSFRREGEPEKLRRKLKGDLDNILLKALRKEPRQRYGSVEQFADDIRRYLNGLPILARQPTLVYRAKKFVRRNRIGVSAAVLILMILIAGMIGINQQRLRAEQRFNDVRRLAHSVVFDYHDAIAELPGSTRVRQKLVKDAMKYLDSLATEAKDDEALQRELAAAYVRIGDVEGNSYNTNLGNMTGALVSYQKSLQLRQAILNAEPDDVERKAELAESYERIGDVMRTTGDVKGADNSYHQAIQILQALSKTSSDEQVSRKLARLFYLVANLRGMARGPNLGNITGCIEFHRQAIAIREALCAANPGDAKMRAELQESHGSLSDILLSVYRLSEAEFHVDRALTLAESLVAMDPKNMKMQIILMGAKDSLGRLLQSKGETKKAMELYLQCLGVAQSAHHADPNDAQTRMSLSARNVRLGNLMLDQGNPAEALKYHRESLKLNLAAAATDSTNDAARRVIALDRLNIGEALIGTGDFKQALQMSREALAYFEKLKEKNSNDRQAVSWLMRAQNQIGVGLLKTGEWKAALESLNRSLALAKSAAARDPNLHSKDRHSALAYFYIGETHAAIASAATGNDKSAHRNEARQAYQRSLELLSELKEKKALNLRNAGMDQLISGKIAMIDARENKNP